MFDCYDKHGSHTYFFLSELYTWNGMWTIERERERRMLDLNPTTPTSDADLI